MLHYCVFSDSSCLVSITMMTLNNDQAANEEATQLVQLTRSAVSFFEKFERYECQEVLAYSSTHWMLSNEDFRLPTDNPMGLIRYCFELLIIMYDAFICLGIIVSMLRV